MRAINFDKNGNLLSGRLSLLDINSVSLTKEIVHKIEVLRTIYSRIPETKCENCGSCCKSYLVINVYLIEFFYIRGLLDNEMLEKLRQRVKVSIIAQSPGLKKKKSSHLITPCPFWDSDRRRCDIYPRRPLTCRVYGLEGLAKSKDCINQSCGKNQCKNLCRFLDQTIAI